MGKYSVDQYSLLHFAVGIIAYFWGFSWQHTLLVHVVFELSENTNQGMYFINNYMPFWPGGKPYADSLVNQASDTLMTMIGWYISRLADSMAIEKHLYP